MPDNLRGIADVFWLGSCLDNISNPSTALKNALDIVKPGGRIIDFECSQMKLNAYIAYSPSFFMDWLAINKFENVRLYLLMLRKDNIFTGDWHVFALDNLLASWKCDFKDIPSDWIILTYWIGDKANETKLEHRNPIQLKYRPEVTHKEYLDVMKKWMQENERPLVKIRQSVQPCSDIKYFNYLGTT